MQIALHIVQTVLALLITGCILLQSQGAGLGQTWSGGGESYHTRRGLEKVLFYTTIVLIGLFTLTSIVNVAL